MYTVFFVIQIILAVLLIGVILIQRSSDDGLSGLGGGGGSGGGNAFLSGRASANLLTRTTAVLAALFMINSLFLANMATRISAQHSIVDTIPAEKKMPGTTDETTQGNDKPAEKAPSVPVAQ